MKPKILIVDDQPENLLMLIESLKSTYNVIVANGGEKALEIATNSAPPDIILLDIIMPEMDGFETCKRLKDSEVTREIPVIFVTVVEAAEDIVKGFEVGGVDYVTKPYKIEEIKSRIATHLKIRLQQRELEELVKELQTSQAINIQQARLNASSELLRSIAHHWRQPLMVIMLKMQHILDSYKMGEFDQLDLEEEVRVINNAITKMSDMINEFTALFAYKEMLDGFPAKESIHKAISFVEAALVQGNVKLYLDIKDDFFIRGYKSEYTRVVMMILSNAIETLNKRLAHDKQIWITLQKGEGDRTVLTIRDNGGGIDPKIIDYIFEPYTSSKFPTFGIGLNLFTCKILIEKHMGGVLEARNTGDGAEFSIIL